MRRVAFVVVLAGCGRVGFDARTDGALSFDTVPDAACVGEFFDPALAVIVQGAWGFGVPGTFDTDTSLQDGLTLVPSVVDTCRNPPVRIVAISNVGVAASGGVTVTGSMPLAIVSNTITIDGFLDAQSGQGACNGATGTADVSGGGGGAGGAYGAPGGNGGIGDMGTAPGGAGAPQLLAIDRLVGGCAGGNGGDGEEVGGIGGAAGGAILLQASTLTITGTVRANGRGGDVGPMLAGGDGGGGGGGSGGMIVLLGGTLDVTSALLFANGGAGAEGTGAMGMAQRGEDGRDAIMGALGGGTGDSDARNDGGDGGYAVSPAGGEAANMSDGGGGGGGGSVGYILYRANMLFGGATTSPAPIPI